MSFVDWYPYPGRQQVAPWAALHSRLHALGKSRLILLCIFADRHFEIAINENSVSCSVFFCIGSFGSFSREVDFSL